MHVHRKDTAIICTNYPFPSRILRTPCRQGIYGLTPYQAIKGGTHDAAEFFDATDELGTVPVGRRADLILLEANPLDDVANVTRRAGVMVRGKWFPQAELTAMLDALAEKYEKAKDKSTAQSSYAEDD